ncbi:MAG: 50S ribosomal protein L32 [Verrucomicrobia bacterium]|nr:50S ribosomal protein L32 [Verrucomicrobiota bacterium]
MGVPKRKMSKSRQRSRRKANSWRAPQTGKCPQCGSSAQPHRVCPSCGYYKGRQVVTIKAGA